MTELERARETINEIDRKMAELFSQRMDAVKLIAKYKAENGMPIYDKSREDEIISKNLSYVRDEYGEYYKKFVKSNTEISKELQQKLIGKAEK